jgi:type I restriction enzyme R subunit
MRAKSPIPFRGFDEHARVRVYRHGILPHWRQDGCTYFVTFRQADSLPQRVLADLEYERLLWLKNHRIDPDSPTWKSEFAKLSKADQRDYERRLGTVLNDLLDAGYGSCALRDARVANIVAESLDYFHDARCLTGDFAIMPNHVHVLMAPLLGFELESILHSIKSYTAVELNRIIGAKGTFWQRESYDHIVRDFEQLESFQQYIAANPEKARLNPCECVLSKATYCAAC